MGSSRFFPPSDDDDIGLYQHPDDAAYHVFQETFPLHSDPAGGPVGLWGESLPPVLWKFVFFFGKK